MKSLENKKKVMVKLYAGLGNQIFQYAYGNYLREEGHTVSFIISPGTGSLTDVFNLSDPNIMEVKNRFASTIIKAWARYIHRAYLTGFFQEARYIEHSGLGIKSFKRKTLYDRSRYPAILKQGETVSVHIRGGDYLRGGAAHQYGEVCTALYYKNAFDYIKARQRDARFFVFTDDPEYAKEVLSHIDTAWEAVDEKEFKKDPGFDLYLMSLCKHHIIANSTFSYWGAVLNPQSGSITIHPDRWTMDDSVDLSTLIPPGWIPVSTAL